MREAETCKRKYKQARSTQKIWKWHMYKREKTCTGGIVCEKGKECKKKHEKV